MPSASAVPAGHSGAAEAATTTPACTGPGDDAGSVRYAPIAGLAWLHFVSDGAANFLPGVLPAVLVAVDRSAALAGVLMFALVAGQALQPVTGMFHRRLGGDRLIWMGAAGTAIGLGLCGSVHSLPALLAVLVLIGIAGACFHPQALAAARTYAGRRGHFGVALMLLGGEIGAGVWPLVAGAVVAWGSLFSLWIPALVVLATLPLAHRWVHAPATTVEAVGRRTHLAGRYGASTRLLAYVALRGFIAIGAVAYLPILWKDRGGGLVGGAALVAVLSLVGMLGLLAGSQLADRVGRRPLLVAAGPLMALGLALIASGSAAALWVGAALTGMAAFATYAVTTLAGQDLFPENRQFGSGIAFGLGNALGAGLAAAAGLLTRAWTVPGLFWILAVAALVTALLGALMRTARPAPAQPAN
ncbi:MAG TPA: MFS transporter [Rhodanobacteraceae bacterium]